MPKVSNTVLVVVERELGRLEEDKRRAEKAAADHQAVADALDVRIQDLRAFLAEVART